MQAVNILDTILEQLKIDQKRSKNKKCTFILLVMPVLIFNPGTPTLTLFVIRIRSIASVYIYLEWVNSGSSEQTMTSFLFLFIY